MSKKIAICFSGQLRLNYKILHFWIENFFNPFIENGYKVFIFYCVPNDKYTNTIDYIKNKLNQFNLTIAKKDDINYENIYPNLFTKKESGIRPSKMVYGFNAPLRDIHSFQNVINEKIKFEKNNNFKFDMVVRARSDVAPIEKFDISKYNINNDVLYIANHDHHNGYSARFTMSKSETSDIVYDIDKFLHRTINSLDEYPGGEGFWKKYLDTITEITGTTIDTTHINHFFYLFRDYDDDFISTEHGNVAINAKKYFSFNPTDGDIIINK